MCVKISKINYDQSGGDSKEFCELFLSNDPGKLKPQIPNDLHLQTINLKKMQNALFAKSNPFQL